MKIEHKVSYVDGEVQISSSSGQKYTIKSAMGVRDMATALHELADFLWNPKVVESNIVSASMDLYIVEEVRDE